MVYMEKISRLGVMLDCSRNAVMRPEKIKEFIDALAKMGYNMLELYMEDTYEIDGEPYFGYLRGGYSVSELKDLDLYASSKGIELVPAIQTLAHFNNLAKLPHYEDIIDIRDILSVENEKTYDLIDKMFKTLAKAFTSRIVNIGMDETHYIGLGKYLDEHGYKNRYDLLFSHLQRVAEIADKYGFTLHMWSDMFFRIGNCGKYYGKDLVVSEDISEKIPKNVELIYWDYYHTQTEDYEAMMQAHKAIKNGFWFAGGAWCWGGFAPFNAYTLKSMKAALQAALKFDVKNVFITMWGDDGKECSFFALLPSLYAVKQYSLGVFDEDVIANGFKALFGFDFYDFMLLDIPNLLPVKHEELETPCKALLYCDPFLGILDDLVEEEGKIDYDGYALKLSEAGQRAGEYRYIFDTLSSLCSVLQLKYDLGVKIRKAYKAGDKAAIHSICGDITEVLTRLKVFYGNFKKLWFIENKTFGFEIQDARLGGLIMRLNSCKERLESYVRGEIEVIDELEKPILPYRENSTLYFNIYRQLISVSEM